MSVDILGTSWDQCRSMVQCCFTSVVTKRLVRTDSPGWPPRLSHSSWTMRPRALDHCFFLKEHCSHVYTKLVRQRSWWLAEYHPLVRGWWELWWRWTHSDQTSWPVFSSSQNNTLATFSTLCCLLLLQVLVYCLFKLVVNCLVYRIILSSCVPMPVCACMRLE